MLMNEKNFIVIQGWMLKQLNLHGNELIVYALIYGFSQDGTWIHLDRHFVAEWLNTGRLATVTDIINRLKEKNLLEFGTDGKYRAIPVKDLQTNTYSTETVPNDAENGSTESVPPHTETVLPSTESVQKSTESVPNNIYKNIYKYTIGGELLDGAPTELCLLIDQWFEYKKQIKKKFKSEQSEKAFINKMIQSYSIYGIEELQRVMNYSIENSYTGYYFDRLGKASKTTQEKPTAPTSYDTSKFIQMALKANK